MCGSGCGRSTKKKSLTEIAVRSFFVIIGLVVSVVSVVSLGGRSSAANLELVDRLVLKVPLNQYEIQTWAGDPTDSVADQVYARGGIAGINGTYFCPSESAYDRCGAGDTTDAERIVAGQDYSLHAETGIRGIFGFDRYGDFLFVQKWQERDTTRFNRGNGYRGNTNRHRRDDVYWGLGNFPILIDEGEIVTHLYDEGHFREHLVTPGRKGFICIDTPQTHVYMGFVDGVDVHTLAATIKERYDCSHAINLDAGASSALYIDGRHLVGPGRQVTDGFLVVPKHADLYGRQTDDGRIVGGNSDAYFGYQLSDADKMLTFRIMVALEQRLQGEDPKMRAQLVRQIFAVTMSDSVADNPRLKKILQAVVRGLALRG